MNRYFFSAVGAGMLLTSSAYAHSGAGALHGFTAGLSHPFAGLDHMLAMIGVGLLAAQLKGKALTYVPASFVMMMVLGAMFALGGVAIPYVELGIVGSVIALGAVVAFGRQMPLLGAMAFVGVLAVFHGFAHGLEMPLNVDGAQYGIGFALATSLLHAAGLLIGLGAEKVNARFAPELLRIGGYGMTTAGIMLLIL